MTEFFEISKEKLEEGIQYSLVNISVLLDHSQKACQKYTDNSIALGLYTFAIEEFGKLLYLLESFKTDKESYQIPKDIFFGQKSHKIKFEKSLQLRSSFLANLLSYNHQANYELHVEKVKDLSSM